MSPSTPATPVEQVAALLIGAGYRRLPEPLLVADLTFAFPAALVGTPPSPDLVVVADTALEPSERLLRRIEGLARALDVVGSRRPLTAVLAGPRPSTHVMNALTKVCRVLPVGTKVDPADSDPMSQLKNWLAVLLPLDVPNAAQQIADPRSDLAKQATALAPDVADLMSIALEGASAVQRRLHTIIANAIAGEGGGSTK